MKSKRSLVQKFPEMLRLYTWWQSQDPDFYSHDLKIRDQLYNYREELMSSVYAAPRNQLTELWQTFDELTDDVTKISLASFKQDILANVALAKAFDQLHIKYGWIHAEDNGHSDFMTFWVMKRWVVVARASEGDLEIVKSTKTVNTGRTKNIEQEGYYFMLPPSYYDPLSGDPSNDLVSEVAKLSKTAKFQTVEQWREDVLKLNPQLQRRTID